MTNFDKDILSEDWKPTQETLDLLKLNSLDTDHVFRCLDYLKQEYPNTHIKDVPNYETWSSLLVMFCIKAAKEVKKS